MYTSTPSVVIAANVRPGLTGSESTPPWPKIHGFSINTTSWPASGEYTLQPASPNAINIIRYFIDLPFKIRVATVCVHPLPTVRIGQTDRPAQGDPLGSSWNRGLVER